MHVHITSGHCLTGPRRLQSSGRAKEIDVNVDVVPIDKLLRSLAPTSRLSEEDIYKAAVGAKKYVYVLVSVRSTPYASTWTQIS
jgi:hypothetical protein